MDTHKGLVEIHIQRKDKVKKNKCQVDDVLLKNFGKPQPFVLCKLILCISTIQLVSMLVEPAPNFDHIFQMFVRERRPFPLRIMSGRGDGMLEIEGL